MKPKSHWLKSLSLTFVLAALVICLPYLGGRSLTAYADGEFTVSENGVLTKYNGSDADVVIPNNVTRIGDGAFQNNGSVKSVTIPESVTAIGNSAFRNCANLQTVSMSDTVTSMGSHVFRDNPSLTSVTLSEGLTSMGESTFENCAVLTSVTIPDSVAALGKNSFYNCPKLQTVTYGAGMRSTIVPSDFAGCGELQNINVAAENPIYKSIDGVLFNKAGNKLIYYPHGRMDYTYEIPAGVKIIGEDAFSGISYLTEMTIPSPVTTISKNAFANCGNIQELTIGDTVRFIQENAFCRNSNLETVTLGEAVESIGKSAFYECTSLTAVSMPDSLYDVGVSAFSGCTSLRRVRFSNGLESLGEYAFNGTALNTVTLPVSLTAIPEGLFKGCEKLVSVTLPDTITSIGSRAFQDDKLLTTVNIPDGVISMGSEVFRNCPALKSVTMPDTVETMGTYVFCDCTALQNVKLSAALESVPPCTCYNCPKLTSVTMPTAAVSIGSSAFDGCLVLPSITLPDTITSIDSYAFQHCRKLTAITLPQNLTAINYRTFADCTSLSSISVPAKVTAIGAEAFDGCAALTTVTLVDGLKTVRYNAFRSCAALESITFPDTVTVLESGMLSGCIELKSCTLPVGLTAIPSSFFEGDVKLTSFSVPAKVTVIGSSAFRDCVTLAQVTLPEKLETIESNAFRNCQELSSITFPATLTTIGEAAFYDCSTLNGVVFPDALKTLGRYAFQNCAALTSITLPANLTKLSDACFAGCTYLETVNLAEDTISIAEYAFSDCKALKNIHIPDKVTTIGYRAFRNCIRLTEIALPDSVTDMSSNVFGGCIALRTAKLPAYLKNVPDSTFDGCYSMTAVTLPDAVETFGQYSFQGCESLREVAFPATVTRIGYCAFNGCKSLRAAILPEAVTSLDSYAFTDCTSLSVVSVPAGLTGFGWHSFYNNATVTDVYYDGTEEAWNALLSGHDMFNTTRRMHYGMVYPGPTLMSIAVATFPNKAEYAVGQVFDPAGLTLLATYDDRSTAEISEDIVCTTAPFVREGLQQVTVEYGGKRTFLTVRVYGAISLLAQPEDVIVNEGQNVSFSVEATGDNLSYQWYCRKAGETKFVKWDGQNTPVAQGNAQADWNGMTVYCVIKDKDGHTVKSLNANVTVNESTDPILPPVEIVEQPADASAPVNDKVTFTVKAVGADVTYQWYYKKSGQNDWTKWNGKTAPSVTTVVYNSWNNAEFYCEVKDSSSNTARSEVAVMTVAAAKITQQPVDAVAMVGDQVTFSVKATGSNLTYQWYMKKAGQTDYAKWNGKTAASVTTPVYASWNDALFYCEIKNSAGFVTKTDVVSLKAVSILITKQPVSFTGKVGDSATFSVEATGTNLTYQWYIKKSGQTDFTKWSSRTASEVTTPVYASWNDAQFYCEIKDSKGNTVVTDTVTLTVGVAEPIRIIEQPTNVTGQVNATATFAVAAEGDGLTYQWYYKKAGESGFTAWNKRTTASVSTPIYNSWNGAQFYCEITDSKGNTAQTDTVTLTVGTDPIKITAQPQDFTGPVNGTATFAVTATGDGLTYQWYYRKAGQNDWTKWSGKTTASAALTIYNSWNDAEFYVEISDSKGNTLNSDVATLIVGAAQNNGPQITAQPQNVTGAVNAKATFTVAATGSSLTYQWYYKKSGESAWTKWNNQTGTSASLTIYKSWNDAQFYCVVTDGSGKTASSNTAKLTVQ